MNYLLKEKPLLVIIGPSGSGKSELVNMLLDNKIIELTATYTTRPKRTGEESARDHVFIDDEEFALLENKKHFLEVVSLFDSNYKYGISKILNNEQGRVPTIMLRAMVMPLLSKHYSNPIIYHIESSKNLIKKRINNTRRESTNNSRIKLFDQEIEYGRKHSNRIFVNDGTLEELYINVESAITKDFK